MSASYRSSPRRTNRHRPTIAQPREPPLASLLVL